MQGFKAVLVCLKLFKALNFEELWLQGSISRADILCLRDGKQVSAEILEAASGLGRLI